MNQNSSIAGQAVYSKEVLSVYDFWVLGISNKYFWKCPTPLIGQHFSMLVSDNQLDVGVGTGYYLKNYLPNTINRIALLDLNRNSLETASRNVSHLLPEIYCGDILRPLELGDGKFNSISINYLLHCLPGDMVKKGIVFKNLNEQLCDGGVLFGSTILGKGTVQNYFARKLLKVYNDKGIFCNYSDDISSLVNSLKEHFSDVKVEVVGCVALFSAKKQ